MIRRIHVVMKLAAPESARETIERVHGFTSCDIRYTGRAPGDTADLVAGVR